MFCFSARSAHVDAAGRVCEGASRSAPVFVVRRCLWQSDATTGSIRLVSSSRRFVDGVHRDRRVRRHWIVARRQRTRSEQQVVRS